MSMTRRQFLGAAAAGTAAVGAGAYARAGGPDYAVQGIDVSRHQLTIDWQRVANTGKKFVFVKATEGHPGGTFEPNREPSDPRFAVNWQGALSVGMIRGAYHMVRPSMGDAKRQVDHFLDTVKPTSGDLRPMLDLELDSTMPATTLWRFIQLMVARIKFKLGKAPFLYTNVNYWRNVLGNPLSNLDCPLWIANWNVETPTVHTAWNTWTLWQYSSTGSVDGIGSVNCDLDAFNGGLADLNKYRLP